MKPNIQLINIFDVPYDNAIATARTCYSSKGIVTPQQTSEKTELRDRIGEGTYGAGHHTVYTHCSVQFAISDISRFAIWSFLHESPNHNSEQQSFRYCEVKPSSVYIPKFKNQKSTELYLKHVEYLHNVYKELITRLIPEVHVHYFDRFKGRLKNQDKYKGAVKKLAQEIARYVLPLSTLTSLYHTIPLITLIRYQQTVKFNECSQELIEIIEEMVRLVCERDPNLERLFQETPQFPDFEPNLGPITSSVELVNHMNTELLGKVDLELFASTVNCHNHLPNNKHLNHILFTFDKCTSHVCDSQAQRHRTVSRETTPLRDSFFTNFPYYETPKLIKQSCEKIQELYTEAMESSYRLIIELLDSGEDKEDVLYLSPNSVKTRVRETTNLANLIHKHKMRLCYNALEEFWYTTTLEKQLIGHIDQKIGNLLQPPCVFRKWSKTTPYCPEKDRYCGVPVWNLELDQYERVI